MPYTSWIDFGMAMRHEASLVNFVAAYGTHASITGATTVATKRAAATALFDLANNPNARAFLDGKYKIGSAPPPQAASVAIKHPARD